VLIIPLRCFTWKLNGSKNCPCLHLDVTAEQNKTKITYRPRPYLHLYVTVEQNKTKVTYRPSAERRTSKKKLVGITIRVLWDSLLPAGRNEYVRASIIKLKTLYISWSRMPKGHERWIANLHWKLELNNLWKSKWEIKLGTFFPLSQNGSSGGRNYKI
jgi:hypothetical protein